MNVRETILRYVPNEERNRVYESLLQKKATWISHSVPILALLFTVSALVNTYIVKSGFLWGYIFGCYVIGIGMIVMLYRTTGRVWRPLSKEEMER